MGKSYVIGVGFVGLSRADKMPGVLCEEEEESGARTGVVLGVPDPGGDKGCIPGANIAWTIIASKRSFVKWSQWTLW